LINKERYRQIYKQKIHSLPNKQGTTKQTGHEGGRIDIPDYSEWKNIKENCLVCPGLPPLLKYKFEDSCVTVYVLYNHA